MSEISSKVTVIYLDDCMLLSKKIYSDWKEIQDEYPKTYKASLKPMTYEELISFFEIDFIDEKDWPFSRNEIREFLSGRAVTIQSMI